MNILAFDTSTPVCSVALSVAGKIYSEHEILPRKQSDCILPFIDRLLQRAAVSRAALDLIVCGIGPGSFMGTRLAVSVAQGLAYALGKPVLPLSTLRVLAQSSSYARVVAAWDARMEQIYVGRYRRDANGIMCPEAPDCIVSPSALEIHSVDSCYVLGNAWSVYADDIPQVLRDAWLGCDAALYPHAKAMIEIAQCSSPDVFISAESLQPLYLRAPVAL